MRGTGCSVVLVPTVAVAWGTQAFWSGGEGSSWKGTVQTLCSLPRVPVTFLMLHRMSVRRRVAWDEATPAHLVLTLPPSRSVWSHIKEPFLTMEP